jgi:hypothetical protein
MTCPEAHNCKFIAELKLLLRERDKIISKLEQSNDTAWKRTRIVESKIRRIKRRR